MNADTNSWHSIEGGQNSEAQIDPDYNQEYLHSERDRVEEMLQQINQKQMSDLDIRMKTKLQEENIDEKTMYYIASFQEGLKILQGVKSGRSFEKMIDDASKNMRVLDAILAIGDFSEDSFPFLQEDENMRYAVTFLRREIGFHAYHNHRNTYNTVCRIREQREQEEIEKIKRSLKQSS